MIRGKIFISDKAEMCIVNIECREYRGRENEKMRDDRMRR